MITTGSLWGRRSFWRRHWNPVIAMMRISWDEAFDIIAKKILAIKKEYGNTLPICLDKYSGNFNLLNYCVKGMMSSIGHTTRATGTPCWPAGIDAQTFDFGTIWNWWIPACALAVMPVKMPVRISINRRLPSRLQALHDGLSL